MTIYVDADSCPVRVREIICKAAQKRQVDTCFVAGLTIPLPSSPHIRLETVEPGPDSADKKILELSGAGDLVITRDIPFAADLVEQGVNVINDRGTEYNKENIRSRLSVRDFMAELRSMGLPTDRERTMNQKDIQAFASTFDRVLTSLLA